MRNTCSRFNKQGGVHVSQRWFFVAVTKSWKALERLPLAPMEVLFASFLDITTPPSQMLLESLASLARSSEERDRLLQLSKVGLHRTLSSYLDR